MKKRVVYVSLLSMLVIFAGCSSGSEAKKSVDDQEKSQKIAQEKEEKNEEYLDYDNQDKWEFTAGQVRHVSL